MLQRGREEEYWESDDDVKIENLNKETEEVDDFLENILEKKP
jgi:hypothetical protein